MRQFSAPKQPDTVRILLVDDNEHGQVARKSLLQELGFHIETARNGEEALDLYAKGDFHLVVTDFKMPLMDGVELIKRIRKVDPNARVIMLSGYVEPLGLTEESTGANIVLSKSAGEVGNLIRAVTRLLKKPPASQRRVVPRTKAHKA